MKTNLDSLFKTNASLETDGIKVNINDQLFFTLRRYGGRNTNKIMEATAKYNKPYASYHQQNKKIPEEEARTVLYQIFAEACIVGWEGVTNEEGPLEFSVDNAVKLFQDMPDFYDFLMSKSVNMDSFKDEVGNS